MTSDERAKANLSTAGIMPDGSDIDFWAADEAEATALRNAPRVPPEVRAEIRARVRKVNTSASETVLR